MIAVVVPAAALLQVDQREATGAPADDRFLGEPAPRLAPPALSLVDPGPTWRADASTRIVAYTAIAEGLWRYRTSDSNRPNSFFTTA